MDSLSSLAAFVHAAEQQSYRAAARIIGVSPSAIGKAVSRLEERIGVRLFNRTTRNISLTEEGSAFYERCKRIIDDLEDAETALIESQQRPKGRLRVSVPHIVGHHLLMPMLPVFVERYPDIDLDIDFDDRVADLVTEGLDVAIRSGELQDSSLIARRLGEQHFVVCGSPAYFDRRGRPEAPADLAQHVCIHFKYPTSGRLAPWAFAARSERVLLSRSLTFNNTDAALRAALDGLGVAHLPIYVAAPYMHEGRLIPVLTSHMVEFGAFSLVWPTNRQLSPKVRAFVTFVVEQLAIRPDAFQSGETLLRQIALGEDRRSKKI